MEASGPDSQHDGERRARRARFEMGVLAVLVVALGIALGIALTSGDDGDGGDAGGPGEPAATAPTTGTGAPRPTVTAGQPPVPGTPTATSPPEPTIGQPQAKEAVARAASARVRRAGISIEPGGWDVRCTAYGGRPQAALWTCQVAAKSGQCAGAIVAYARAPGVAATRDPQVGCGE